MKPAEKLSEYFHFTRKDRIAIIIIALILLTTLLLPPVLEKQKNILPPAADTAWMAVLHQLEKPVDERQNGYYREKSGNMSDENNARDRTADEYNNDNASKLFSFDPNLLDAAGWKKLGIREKTIGTILKYRNKGGIFRKPGDLQRIYGLPAAQYKRLQPYISITDNIAPAPPGQWPGRELAENLPAPRKKIPAVLDINTADSSLYERLPGIGPTLAMRIIRFRDKLGGFYSVEQVRETFGLADSVFQKIRPYLRNDHPETKQMDLNKISVDELKAHPYVRYNLANAIVQYRNQHGPFGSVEDLKKIAAIDHALCEQLAHYFFVAK